MRHFNIQKLNQSKFLLFVGLLFSIFHFLFSGHAFAQSLSVQPAVLDIQVKKEAPHSDTLLLKNNSDRTLVVYGYVQDILPHDGEAQTEVERDITRRSTSVDYWLRFPEKFTGFKLKRGEEKEIPLSLVLDPRVLPGEYYGELRFSFGTSLENAKGNSDYAKTFVRVHVLDPRKEGLVIKEFNTKRNVFLKFPAIFSYSLQNTGDFDLSLQGGIHMYDGRGKEVGVVALDFPPSFTAGGVIETEKGWMGDVGFGKYKAKLRVEYGSSSEKIKEDVVYFWIVPMKYVWGIIVAFAFLLGAMLFLRARSHDHDE